MLFLFVLDLQTDDFTFRKSCVKQIFAFARAVKLFINFRKEKEGNQCALK
jgi:hypothetical protein